MSHLTWGAGNARPCWAACPSAGCCSQPLHPVWSCLPSILQASSGILRPFPITSASPIVLSLPLTSRLCSGPWWPAQEWIHSGSAGRFWLCLALWAWLEASLGWFFLFCNMQFLISPQFRNLCIRLHRFQMNLILPVSVFVALGFAVCRFNWSILFCSISQAPHATKFRMDHFSLCFKVCGV